MHAGWLRWFVTRPLRRAQIYAGSLHARARRRRVVHMLHVGKTGGTALKHALRRHPPADPSVHVVTHHHDVSLMDLPPWDDVFFVLRDPITRYVSAFNSRLRQGRPRYNVPWSQAERRCFARFRTPEELALGLDDIDPQVRRQARRSMRSIRHVSWHYRKWLGGPRRLRARREHILLVGHQETLDADFERLKELLSLPAEARLPNKDTTAHRSPADTVVRLSERAQVNLTQWYRDDYELLGYLDDQFR